MRTIREHDVPADGILHVPPGTKVLTITGTAGNFQIVTEQEDIDQDDLDSTYLDIIEFRVIQAGERVPRNPAINYLVTLSGGGHVYMKHTIVRGHDD